PGGSGTGAAAQHSQSLEALLTHIPGLKVIQPSTSYDAKGLLLAAIDDPNPVIFYEQKLLYNIKGHVPEHPFHIPIGQAEVKREGRYYGCCYGYYGSTRFNCCKRVSKRKYFFRNY